MMVTEKKIRSSICGIILSLIATACASTEQAKETTRESIDQNAREISKLEITQSSLDDLTASWPEASRKAISDLTEKYGLPNEATASMVIWHNNGPWKRSIVYKEEVTHLFPKKHPDVLEQFVNYQVPVDKFDDIARYDGSVIVERTKGEMSARCDKEEMNFLALNLAQEIAEGKKTSQEARKEYAKSAMSFMAGKENDYTDNLNFRVSKNTADPDHRVMKEMMTGKDSEQASQE